MNLFNIGVDGQYRMAALIAAGVGGAVALPAPLHVLLIVVVAMLVGAFWAGIAAILKVTRGVSEVISTIMLNFIATGLIAYLLTPGRLAETIEGSNNVSTKPIPPSGQMPGLPLIPDAKGDVFGFILVAVVVGAAYWFLLGRTRFGFDLRATGTSEPAAVASGVNVKRMVLVTMLLSGAVAGLVGMPQLLGSSHAYSLDFPAGLGFTGIAIALLGSQQSHRDRLRRAAVGIPGQLGDAARLRGHPQRDRPDHAGRPRPVSRGGLRAGPTVFSPAGRAVTWDDSWEQPSRLRRREQRHELRDATAGRSHGRCQAPDEHVPDPRGARDRLDLPRRHGCRCRSCAW